MVLSAPVMPSSSSSVVPMASSAYQRLISECAATLQRLNQQGLKRELRSLDAIRGPQVQVDGKRLINWCSNDYLGLSTHPALAQAAAEASLTWGVGARASRLLAGTTRWHTQLEASLATFFNAERAMVYPSGYQANLGTLGALIASQDLVLLDRLAHASLVDAIRATRATLKVFHHNEVAHVASLLTRARGNGRRWIVTEGVFSMEGDAAPLCALLEVAQRRDALLYVDDAHGAFVVGATGRGSPEVAGVAHERLIYMGTLGKGLGCQGGFVIGPHALIDLLHHRARTFIYTTALAVPVAAAATAALALVQSQEGARRRARLEERVRQLNTRLATMTQARRQSRSHIMPVLLGEATHALAVAERLFARGHWAPAIRPPTVPRGSARLRLSVTALHTAAHVDRLMDALRDALTRQKCLR